MFISKASRHDAADVVELLEPYGIVPPEPRDGIIFIARDGKLVGCLRMKEVAPHAIVIDKMIVREDRRRQGIGTSLIQAAMNNLGGKLYLYCHDDTQPFYEKLDFERLDPDAVPEPVMNHFMAANEYPAPNGHPEHIFLTAR